MSVKPVFIILLLLGCKQLYADSYEVKCPGVSLPNKFKDFKVGGPQGSYGWNGEMAPRVYLQYDGDVKNNTMVCYYRLAKQAAYIYKLSKPVPADTQCRKSSRLGYFNCFEKYKKIDKVVPDIKSRLK